MAAGALDDITILEIANGLLDAEFGSQPFVHWAPHLDRSDIIWGKVSELPDLIADPAAPPSSWASTPS